MLFNLQKKFCSAKAQCITRRLRQKTSSKYLTVVFGTSTPLKVFLNFECATLYQIGGIKPCEIAAKLNRSKSWVSKWKNSTEYHDAPRSGAPVTALTDSNMKKLEDCRGKLGRSVRVMKSRLNISIGSVSGGFKKLGLFAYRRGVQSRLKKKHIKQRYEVAKRMRHYDVDFWERFLITDEKIWTVDGYFNPQNDRVRARKKEEVEAVERDKFRGKRMVWLDMSALGTTPLVHFEGNVNGEKYQHQVLKKKCFGGCLAAKENDWNAC